MHLEMFAILEEEDLSFEIALLSKNAPAQPLAMEDNSSSIKVTPPPIISLLKLTDWQVIAKFKAYYLMVSH